MTSRALPEESVRDTERTREEEGVVEVEEEDPTVPPPEVPPLTIAPELLKLVLLVGGTPHWTIERSTGLPEESDGRAERSSGGRTALGAASTTRDDDDDDEFEVVVARRRAVEERALKQG